MANLLNLQKSTPTIREFWLAFPNETATFDYLNALEMFPQRLSCPKCRLNTLRLIPNGLSYKCNKRNCQKQVSIKKGTLFFNRKIEITEILFLGLLRLNKIGIMQVISLSGHSTDTVVNYYNEFCTRICSTLTVADTRIDGNGVVVQVGECKMGKRKYHRGHGVKGTWILGGVELTDKKKVFLLEIPDRSMATLTSIILDHMLDGSIIVTDMWKGYNKLYQY